jgi:hypothetical protein
MTAMILPAQYRPESTTHHATDEYLQVSVHLQVMVMAPPMAQHKATVWLSMNAGHLLLAENPELVLGQPLIWRFDVVRSLPRRAKPGTVNRTFVGRMAIDAVTGEVVNPETLIQELTTNAGALTQHAA